MTGKGHRISTFAFVAGATASPVAAVFSLLGSTFPDSSEYLIFGKKRNRYHRRYTHWFIPWLVMAVTCFSRAGWIVPRLSALIDGREAHRDVWACAGFWLMGCVLHIFEDAWCGTVPFLRPWKRDIGLHVFRMSPNFGELSYGEKTFILCSIILAVIAFVIRSFTLKDLVHFWNLI